MSNILLAKLSHSLKTTTTGGSISAQPYNSNLNTPVIYNSIATPLEVFGQTLTSKFVTTSGAKFVKGAAKAYVHFNPQGGSPVQINRSYNVDNVLYGGTAGNYIILLNSDIFIDSNINRLEFYSIAGSVTRSITYTGTGFYIISAGRNSFRIQLIDSTASPVISANAASANFTIF